MRTTTAKDLEERKVHPLACTGIDDLYLPAARATLTRVLSKWLNHDCLTVTEFLHSAAALQKFEIAGTTYQHAVQRTAVLLAGQTKIPVVQIIKALNALADGAIARVYKDERRGLFVEATAGNLAELAEVFAKEPNALYLLNGSLAKYLAAAKTWDEKLLRVLGLRVGAPEDGAGRELIISAVDCIIADIMNNQTAIIELLGAKLEYGPRLFTALHIFRGIASTATQDCSKGLMLLASYFARDELSDARLSLANFIHSELEKTNRLCLASWDGELEAFRQLVDELSIGESKYLNRDDLHAAFAERSKRFVTQEYLVQFLAQAKAPDQKLDRLLTLSESIVGEANKRSLAPLALTILTGRNVEEEFNAGAPCVLRLKRAAELQKRIQSCGFPDVQRDKMAGFLDGIAVQIEANGRFFALMGEQAPGPADRVEAYLKLFAAGVLTDGTLAQKARQSMLALLASPKFIAQYAGDGIADRKAPLMDMVARLKQIGISPQDSLRAMTPPKYPAPA